MHLESMYSQRPPGNNDRRPMNDLLFGRLGGGASFTGEVPEGDGARADEREGESDSRLDGDTRD
jgi:hypothetical protein